MTRNIKKQRVITSNKEMIRRVQDPDYHYYIAMFERKYLNIAQYIAKVK